MTDETTDVDRPPVDSLSGDDTKLVTLARGARARVGAAEGAALRDETGRTYTAANVRLPSLTLTGIQLAVAQAVAAGAHGCEAAVCVSARGSIDAVSLAALSDLGGPSVPVIACLPDGTIAARLTAGCPE